MHEWKSTVMVTGYPTSQKGQVPLCSLGGTISSLRHYNRTAWSPREEKQPQRIPKRTTLLNSKMPARTSISREKEKKGKEGWKFHVENLFKHFKTRKPNVSQRVQENDYNFPHKGNKRKGFLNPLAKHGAECLPLQKATGWGQFHQPPAPDLLSVILTD